MSLRTKFAAVFLVLLILPIVATTAVEIDRTMAAMVDELGDTAALLVAQTFEQVRLMPAAANGGVLAAMRADRALRAFTEASQAFGKGIVYVRIEKLDGTIILGGGGKRRDPRTAPQFDGLRRVVAQGWPLSRIRALWTPRTFEMSRALEVKGKPFALIVVGISTALISPRVHRALAGILVVAAGAVALSLIGAVFFGAMVLRPLAAITSGIEQMAVGRDDVRVQVAGTGELNLLAEKFNQLSRTIRLNRDRWEAERGHLVSLFRSISDAVLLLDSNGAVLFANDEAEGRLGLPAGGLANGKPLERLLGGGSALVRIVNTAQTVGAGVHDVPLEIGEDAHRVHFLVSVFSVGQGRASRGMLVILRDLEPVRGLRAARDEIERLDKAVEALGPFAEPPASAPKGGRPG